ncbi:MAG: hypothetical protein K8R48_02515 [Alphaproteobacteria bacterium]|nr:hypothetical protein [Alphaproteobacteria bacterium]
MKKFLVPIFLILLSSQSYADAPRLQKVTLIFENFEAGFAYLNHCGDFKKTLYEQPLYMGNAQLTWAVLAEELTSKYPDVPQDQIKAMFEERRKKIQTHLDKIYMENGCTSVQANAAKKWVDLMSKELPDNVLNIINQSNPSLCETFTDSAPDNPAFAAPEKRR